MKLILALTEKYHALVMNPPYMGSGNMNGTLSKYVKDYYAEGKADLFSTFMILAIDRLLRNGKYGMINMHAWMFLSSFEALRHTIIEEQKIDSLLHLGPRTFDELSGEVVQNAAFVITNTSRQNSCNIATEQLQHHDAAKNGTYFRLVEGKNCSDKEKIFSESLLNKDPLIYYPQISQNKFNQIPEYRMGYWVSDNIAKKWKESLFDDSQIIIRQGLASGDNDRFIRMWYEISESNFNTTATSCEDAINSGYKWFPFHKGGESRSWYGNSGNVISFDRQSYDVLLTLGNHLPSREYYFLEGVLFSRISSKRLNAKYTPSGFVFDGSAPLGIAQGNLYEKLGFMCSNSITAFLQVLAPTLTFQVGDVRKSAYVPISNDSIENKVKDNISISRQDWDAHETSWDFQINELLTMDEDVLFKNLDYKVEKHFKETGERICIDPAPPMPESVEWCYDTYCTKWERLFMQLHENEEELNRQFIDIYGLQDELTPEVPLDEITILQQGEVSIENNQLKWHSDVVMKQLISYAVGCMLGRYRLDKPGLHIAHPEPTEEEITPYIYKGIEYEIDDDGIMPLMTGDCGFSDNASIRFADFIRTAFGEETQVENLNFIEQCLGKTVEQYFVKDFWKDHKKMYQNRPIYWLFSSKKGAFQVIAYMHRMNAYTVERVRAKYLLPYIENIQAKIAELDANRASLNTRETKQLQQLQKTLEECREYHDRLQVVAEQAIGFDLDDGVVVNHAKYGDVLQKIK